MFNIKDPAIILVMYLDVVLLILTLLLLALVVIFRLRLDNQERGRERFMQVWQPVMDQSMYGLAQLVPRHSAIRIKPADTMNFLLLWNRLQEVLRGEVRENLNAIAHSAKIDAAVLKMLHKGNLSKRLLAINTVGHLRELSAWETLVDIVQENQNPILALTAARALARMDGEKATAVFVPLLVLHKEWPASHVVGILKELNLESFSRCLADAILRAVETDVPRLVRYLRFASGETALAVVHDVLHKYNNAEVLSACLYVIGEFGDRHNLGDVRNFAKHHSWVVRLQVAHVLGKIGTRDDIKILLELLTDREWWVRYRAANALSSLPFVTIAEIEQFRLVQSDTYASDALTQILVEKRLLV